MMGLLIIMSVYVCEIQSLTICAFVGYHSKPATAGICASAAALTRSFTRTMPSTSKNSVCKWRCTNGVIGVYFTLSEYRMKSLWISVCQIRVTVDQIIYQSSLKPVIHIPKRWQFIVIKPNLKPHVDNDCWCIALVIECLDLFIHPVRRSCDSLLSAVLPNMVYVVSWFNQAGATTFTDIGTKHFQPICTEKYRRIIPPV